MMTVEEFLKDKGSAALALMDWLENQELSPAESVPVLAIAMAAIVKGIAQRKRQPVKPVLDHAVALIKEIVEDME